MEEDVLLLSFRGGLTGFSVLLPFTVLIVLRNEVETICCEVVKQGIFDLIDFAGKDVVTARARP